MHRVRSEEDRNCQRGHWVRNYVLRFVKVYIYVCVWICVCIYVSSDRYLLTPVTRRRLKPRAKLIIYCEPERTGVCRLPACCHASTNGSRLYAVCMPDAVWLYGCQGEQQVWQARALSTPAIISTFMPPEKWVCQPEIVYYCSRLSRNLNTASAFEFFIFLCPRHVFKFSIVDIMTKRLIHWLNFNYYHTSLELTITIVNNWDLHYSN